ncbi:MAG: hydroxyacid dehydrogenase, partial [Lachnospiraceae bacterium]|nr:hydroxyacid dehydrogenase [Lachnospiraceae bacterium]
MQSASLVMDSYSDMEKAQIAQLLNEETAQSARKIIVLDDDPTGVQTVHDVHVYTDWSVESIRRGFAEENALFFILTNSRGFTEAQTRAAHTEIAERVSQVAAECRKPYMIISRSDSTLRGHFPLETQVLRDTICKESGGKILIDGEILCPYFKEGGRFTLGDVHYVKYGEELIPAADTEFAKDETFGYHASNLAEYIEEKTGGAFRAESVTSISLQMLRAIDIDGITKKLLQVRDFGKIIVNATCDTDV